MSAPAASICYLLLMQALNCPIGTHQPSAMHSAARFTVAAFESHIAVGCHGYFFLIRLSRNFE